MGPLASSIGQMRCGRTISFLCPFFLGERFPVAFFHLTNQRCPGLRLGVERELVRQGAFFRVPPKFNRVFFVIELASTGRVETRTINIEPMTGVSFFGLNKANEYERFVVRRLIRKTVIAAGYSDA